MWAQYTRGLTQEVVETLDMLDDLIRVDDVELRIFEGPNRLEVPVAHLGATDVEEPCVWFLRQDVKQLPLVVSRHLLVQLLHAFLGSAWQAHD